MSSIKTSDFDYHLPEEQIAYRPEAQRQNSRLLFLNREDGEIGHRNFYELPQFLNPGDLLVLNNTKVIPARLFGKSKSGRKIEILLVEKLSDTKWKCLVKSPKEGLEVFFEGSFKGTLHLNEKNEWSITFEEGVENHLELHGRMPLPPYIKREPDQEDRISYQTVYADKEGAIAAPTAGLHFTPELLEEIKIPRGSNKTRYSTCWYRYL